MVLEAWIRQQYVIVMGASDGSGSLRNILCQGWTNVNQLAIGVNRFPTDQYVQWSAFHLESVAKNSPKLGSSCCDGDEKSATYTYSDKVQERAKPPPPLIPNSVWMASSERNQ